MLRPAFRAVRLRFGRHDGTFRFPEHGRPIVIAGPNGSGKSTLVEGMIRTLFGYERRRSVEAARVDGATTWQIFWRIAFPLVRPAALVLGLFGFVYAWNDFLWPFIVLKSPERYTVQIAIKALQNNRDIDLGLAMSGSFLATLPVLVLFVFVGRRLVQGIMEGAFKG